MQQNDMWQSSSSMTWFVWPFSCNAEQELQWGFRNKGKKVAVAVQSFVDFSVNWSKKKNSFNMSKECESVNHSLIVLYRLTYSAREENLHKTNEGRAHQERGSHSWPTLV